MVSEFETFKGAIEDLLEYARALPEKWQRSVRRAILESRSKRKPLEEVASDLAVEPHPGGYDVDSVHRDISDRLFGRQLAKRILGHLERADAELPPEQVTELERLVEEGLPND